MNDSCEKISLVSVRWGIGLAVTVIIALSVSLSSFASEAADRDTKQKVLEARVDSLERNIEHVTSIAYTISKDVSTMKELQAAFQASVSSELRHLKKSQ